MEHIHSTGYENGYRFKILGPFKKNDSSSFAQYMKHACILNLFFMFLNVNYFKKELSLIMRLSLLYYYLCLLQLNLVLLNINLSGK